MEIVEILAK